MQLIVDKIWSWKNNKQNILFFRFYVLCETHLKIIVDPVQSISWVSHTCLLSLLCWMASWLLLVFGCYRSFDIIIVVMDFVHFWPLLLRKGFSTTLWDVKNVIWSLSWQTGVLVKKENCENKAVLGYIFFYFE